MGKIKSALGLLAVLGLFAGQASGEEPGAGNMTLSVEGGMTAADVAAIFRAHDLKATIEGANTLTGEGWGYTFSVEGYNCNAAKRCTEYLLTIGFDLPDGFPLEKINLWNAEEPAGRAFLDEDGDPFLDHTVSVSGPDDEEAFWEGLLLWLNALEDYDDYLDEHTPLV